MLQSLVAVNYPSYEPKAWHPTLLIFALLVMGGLTNMYAWFLIPWLETLAGVLHILLFVVFVVVLVTLAPRHSADFVFLKSASSSGWNNQFVSFNMGLMTPTWGFVGEFWLCKAHLQIADDIIRV
jgi:choline transport protein